MAATSIETYDVVVVGGGPVGLLMAYQLRRFGISVCVLEQHAKTTQDGHGRAIAIFPRTSEQLDQLDLIEPMLQLGYACRQSVTYRDGQRVLPGRVWTFMENIKDTAYDFVLVLRQMYTEAIIRQRLQSIGAECHESTKCVDIQVDQKAPPGSRRVTSTFVDTKSNAEFQIRSKYLIGADGGHSFVRRHSGIAFEGDSSEEKWIRIDGIVECDMPIDRAYGAIESNTHGNVLWAPLDHGATRIGYAYSSALAAKYPDGVTQEVAEKEAIECMKPFKLKFKEIHWWTLYTIGQRIARDFSTQDCIFLCGDAAHTHSSGAAQGLNTGIHDAVNLAWKLALHIQGVTQPEIINTYATERMSTVQRLIAYDKDISILMSRKWPSWYKGDPDADPYIVLGEIFEEAASFNTGLGISYGLNVVNQSPAIDVSITPGSRAPDVELAMPGTFHKVRLQRVTRNFAKFSVVVFTGDNCSAGGQLAKFASELQRQTRLKKHEALQWLTVCPGEGSSPFEAIGMPPIGDMYFDVSGQAHDRFGISLTTGGVALLRPDGLVASAGPIDITWLIECAGKILKLDT